MITLTLKLENLTEKAEQYLEKGLANLEKITKKPREYHIKEALIRYINNEWGIRDDTERYMKKDFKGRKRPHEYHVVEALFRYFEDMEDMRDIEEYIKEKKAGKVEYYTSEEVRKELKEYYDAKEAKEKPQINRQWDTKYFEKGKPKRV
ncbi:MAG: hypothetical protein MRERV_14c011 [Mycoplasmataceae bacterium RV_VA103A]|nr:MAG: hypothetical protein MRERV_14c011 [Mycoplasmataceae bacterium RV_VA103A]